MWLCSWIGFFLYKRYHCMLTNRIGNNWFQTIVKAIGLACWHLLLSSLLTQGNWTGCQLFLKWRANNCTCVSSRGQVYDLSCRRPPSCLRKAYIDIAYIDRYAIIKQRNKCQVQLYVIAAEQCGKKLHKFIAKRNNNKMVLASFNYQMVLAFFK